MCRRGTKGILYEGWSYSDRLTPGRSKLARLSAHPVIDNFKVDFNFSAPLPVRKKGATASSCNPHQSHNEPKLLTSDRYR